MQILTTSGWDDYELIDSGNGQRFERYGIYSIVRPDPQAIWQPILQKQDWEKTDAVFEGAGKKGHWIRKTQIPDSWQIRYRNLRFIARLTPFKHTGIFPEQCPHWEFMAESIKNYASRIKGKTIKVLNLFGYTGAASIVCTAAGSLVTHVDASKPAITWAHENQIASGLSDKPIRWIIDDALKFTLREARRGEKYDGIIMDPPVYGHGPDGEIWDFPKSFPKLLGNCKAILSDTPLFIVVNAYAISSSAIMLANVMHDYFHDLKGKITYGELALQESEGKRLLSTGIYARWSVSTS